MKKKNIDRFILISFTVTIFFCISILVSSALSMNKRSSETITKIGYTYMEEINNGICNHFNTTINLRLSQVETIINKNPPEENVYGEEFLSTMKNDGKARNFPYLALMSTDGEFEKIYGEDLTLLHPDVFLKSMNENKNKVAAAFNDQGDIYIMLGVSTEYHMKNGKTNTALVAAISVEYLSNILSLDNENGELTYSNIITQEGEYIIRNSYDKYDNYFDRVEHLFNNTDKTKNQSYVSEMKEAMSKRESYSAMFVYSNEQRHFFCTPLPQSEWYLITTMPYGKIETVINDLSHQRFLILTISIIFVFIIFSVIFFLYIKRSKKQYEQLELARKEAVRANKAKSEFLSNMSHDIRTPMNAIVGMTSIALANIDDKNRLENSLKNISRSNKQLLRLINDILDISKIENGKLQLNTELVSLRDVIDDIVTVIQPQIRAKNQSFDVFIRDIICEKVYSDSVRLNQVIQNLVSNALKFTPEKGRITLSIWQEESPIGDDHIRVHIDVKDNGIGMDDEFQKIIFDSFSRADSKRVQKTEGTGLGMSITKYIIDAMHGTIDLISAPGKGTEFRIVIDMERAEEDDANMLLPDMKILIVDDDEILCESAVITLKEIGVSADYALSGKEAADIIQKLIADGIRYDIILLDWKMPEMDGLETAQMIMDIFGHDIPVIIISAYDWSDIESEALSAGVSGFISKPLFKSTLYHALKKYSADSDIQNDNEIKRDYNGIKILVAEDNEINWEVIYELLEPMGFELDYANNGKICTEMFAESEPGYYSAILMDVRMPLMTGYEATRAIRTMNRTDNDIPIIAMTADAFAEDIRKCLECGMNSHVAKPIDIQEILKNLDKFMK